MTLFEKLLGHTLITADNIWGLMGVMCIGVALSIFLEQKYQWASKVSGAIIALIMAMVLANLGVIPTNSALYDDIVWGVIVPMAIPLLLLQCNLSRVWKDTGRMLIVFLIGAVGTIVGAFIAYYVLRGPFGDAQGLAKVASMMTGSYIGGGVNFAAMASQYAAGDDLTAAATVADNLLMAAYFFVLIACAGSKFFRKHFRHPHIEEVEAGTSKEAAQTQAAAFWSRKDISLKDIAYNFAYAIIVVWVSRIIAGLFSGFAGNAFLDFIGKFLGSQYVWITTISVIVATFCHKQVEKMHGSQEIGTYLIYLFLFVIGVPARPDGNHGPREHAVLLRWCEDLQGFPRRLHHRFQRQHRRSDDCCRYGNLPGLDETGWSGYAGRRSRLCHRQLRRHDCRYHPRRITNGSMAASCNDSLRRASYRRHAGYFLTGGKLCILMHIPISGVT